MIDMRPHVCHSIIMSKTKLQKAIYKVTDGLLGTLTDFLLFQFYLSGELLGTIGSRDIYDAFEKAHEGLEDFNYQKFKKTISYLFRKNLIKKVNLDYKKRLGKIELKISQEGKKRIAEIIPSYQKPRTWDGKFYLITYDIPEERRVKRNLLREYLKRIGCGLLQESVWLSPYNPKEILRDFTIKNGLGGLILISSLGPNRTIGEEDIKTLIKRVYNLEILNKRYKEFIDKFMNIKTSVHPEIYFAYHQILRDDPQLPFELLPGDWLGDKAYKLFISKLSIKVYK